MKSNRPTPKTRYAGYEETARDYFGVLPETVLSLFRQGKDTAEIAHMFRHTSEAVIYSCLARAREKERAA